MNEPTINAAGAMQKVIDAGEGAFGRVVSIEETPNGQEGPLTFIKLRLIVDFALAGAAEGLRKQRAAALGLRWARLKDDDTPVDSRTAEHPVTVHDALTVLHLTLCQASTPVALLSGKATLAYVYSPNGPLCVLADPTGTEMNRGTLPEMLALAKRWGFL